VRKALLLLVAAAAVAAGAAFAYHAYTRSDRAGAVRDAIQRYAAAWRRQDYATMYRLTTPAVRGRIDEPTFAAAYRQALSTASAIRVAVALPEQLTGEQTVARVTIPTLRFGTKRGSVVLHATGPTSQIGIEWDRSMVFPGLRRGERVHRVSIPQGPPAAILASDGSVLRTSSGTTPTWAPGGTLAALARQEAPRLRGRAGERLMLGSRAAGRVAPVPGRPVRTTIVPAIQRAAFAALGASYGGIAVVRPGDGAVLALAGIASSAPQPPGSTFKVITVTAALASGLTSLATSYPLATSTTIAGYTLSNARGESCGGTLVESFAASCNSVFAPLGARVGARRLVAAARRFGFDQRPTVPFAAPSTIPAAGAIGDSLAVGSSAIGQGKVLATPLQMASVAATIAERGQRARLRLVASDPIVRTRATSPHVAAEVDELMRAVVTGGTGTAASLPGVEVAGKTGTAELGQRVPSGDPAADTDAWFVGYAPAPAPRFAVGVLLVSAGFGGDTAAPLARDVLAAALAP
jgi:hypothetical protein